MKKNSTYYNEIINRLERLVKREYALYILFGIQFSLIGALISFASFALFEMVGNFDVLIRTIMFWGFFILLTISLTGLFIIPTLKYLNLLGKRNYHQTAIKLGEHFPSVKDELINAMQLIEEKQNEKVYSGTLIDAAFKQAYTKTSGINFTDVVSFEKAKKVAIYFVSTIVFTIVLFAFIPGLQAATYRIFNYDVEFIPPQKFNFEVKPGDYQITKGDDIELSASINGELPKEVFIAIKREDQTSYELKKIVPDSNNFYVNNLLSVRNSFKYYFTAEDISSKEYKVEVIDPPVISMFDVTISPPAYSKLPVIQQRDNGNVTGLPGTSVSFIINATKNLESAHLSFNDGKVLQLKTSQRQATGSFRITSDAQYRIILLDENDNENITPIIYNVKALQDAFPSIKMVIPNKNVTLPPDNRLLLLTKIQDDYGFNKLVLHYRLSASRYDFPQEEFTSIEIPINKNLKEADVQYIWNLSRLNLATEDEVTYYLEIFDNDAVNGPKSTKTSNFLIRVPSLEDILTGAEDIQQKAEQELLETLKEAEELKETLEKIEQDLRQDKKEITWQEKEKIEQALQKFEELQEKVEQVSKDLAEMQDELQQNNLLSQETLEKYMELQDLISELSSDEMKRAMEKMQDMLKNMDRKQVQDAMKDLAIDEERFKASIERTLNLLKRIQIEQKVDELLKRSEDLTQRQENLENQTGENQNSSQEQNDQLSQKQKDISKDLDQFSKQMEKLLEQMKEFEDMPSDELQEMMDEFNEQGNEEMSDAAAENMKQNQMEQAQQNQQKISSNMKQMMDNMMQMQQQMMMQNQMQVLTDMMRMMNNLLTLSKEQEELKNESQKLDPNSQKFNENAQRQSNNAKNLERLMQQMGELSQKTFAITPEMGQSLGNAGMQMNNALQHLQNRQGSIASNSQGESMKSLNEAAMLMKGAMDQLMQSGGEGSGGMMSLMQQLQQMGGQQMMLNSMTQGLGSQGQLSPEQQGELQRLAQQQEIIQKSLEQLDKEAKASGQSKKIPANLEDIVKQMQEVVSDMKTEKLDDNLVQKQERILSRLLDAQRSINQRDFEKERESNVGENVARQSPAELNLSSDKTKDKLREELIKAVREGYSKDYENLIRRYFESLQNEEIKN